jgi:hypothetical protein
LRRTIIRELLFAQGDNAPAVLKQRRYAQQRFAPAKKVDE